jgi:hypothetical protein
MNSDRFTNFGYFKRAFSTDFSIWLNRFSILTISNWSWKLISIYRFWSPISKTNLPNRAKFLISSLQFDSAKFQFFKMISNSSWPIQSTDFQSSTIQLDSRRLDSISSDSCSVKGSKFVILSPIQFNGLPKFLIFRTKALNANSLQKTRFPFSTIGSGNC